VCCGVGGSDVERAEDGTEWQVMCHCFIVYRLNGYRPLQDGRAIKILWLGWNGLEWVGVGCDGSYLQVHVGVVLLCCVVSYLTFVRLEEH
jgi:hypothetical protein